MESIKQNKIVEAFKIIGKAIFGKSPVEKTIIGIVYLLSFIGLFLPFNEHTSNFRINETSCKISDTDLYVSVLNGYESGLFLAMFSITIFIHFRLLILNRSNSLVVITIWFLAFISFVLSGKMISKAGWGSPVANQTLIGFNLSVFGILLLMLLSFYLHFKRKI